MAKPPIIVTGTTTQRWGRFILSAGAKHIVADATALRGGPGEAFGAGELVMASLCSCGLALVVEAARDHGLPLAEAQIECSYVTDPEDRTRMSELVAVLRVAGVDLTAGQQLLDAFIKVCPIWNTLARSTPHASRVELLVQAA
jgi:uncharacterized OsmC-like protein